MLICPDNKQTSPARQRGSALVVAIFIIVVMSLLASALFGLFSSSSSATVANVGGTRANFAAQSAVQEALLKLFPVAGGAADCSTTTVTFTEPGVDNCNATVTCTSFTLDELDATHYRLQASGSCDIGTETYSRQLLTEATDAND
ncbi:MSHA biogenesis protein MshP [Pseudidiomarina sp.]|uniref:MSHA biogenesis protein MshP n=1 Tax=Pseudidiomarina sp. TaxID=2081707 RepID=UPI00299E72BA|nr:MSHA biogenesis protein MshP [Pseudidiomarina sp.]MDX1706299.1 MSHA biogenesis protein MshP [Pseudidiomarina sp.]